MDFCNCDNILLVGSSVVQRKRGSPMGGTMSAIAAAIDLEDGVDRLYRDREYAKSLGWSAGKMATQQIVQGVQHVDDALVIS